MKCAISPCPNDTYLFYGWLHRHVGSDLTAEVHFADIQQLNRWALSQTFPLTKLSFGCFKKVIRDYQLLPIGAAVGFDCGPKIIAKKKFPLSELCQKKIAIPGKLTTAHCLLNHLQLKPKKKIFCRYHEIMNLVNMGIVDCGVIIHESRFTFQQQGFHEIADLGRIWHAETLLPLPLGGLAIKRCTPAHLKHKIFSVLKESLKFAKQNPLICFPFIQSKAQEKQYEINLKHIQTYVNQETEHLSADAIRAIKVLIDCNSSSNWLYTPSTETATHSNKSMTFGV